MVHKSAPLAKYSVVNTIRVTMRAHACECMTNKGARESINYLSVFYDFLARNILHGIKPFRINS